MQRSAWMRGNCLLGRLPCRTQAAGERYPTHLADASASGERYPTHLDDASASGRLSMRNQEVRWLYRSMQNFRVNLRLR
jgi:hypothetical protein